MNISSINPTVQAEQLKAEMNGEAKAAEGFQEALQKAAESGDVEKLKKVATDFEEVFVNMLLKAMRSTVVDSGLTEKSNQRDIFQGMLDESFAKEMAEAGGIGIADMMVKQLEKYIAHEADETREPFDLKG
ncbi:MULTISPECIES: rod-binding protein [unclassified Fusibacter]|uniref:rod-binding protein n=1 Tax=unclassified Fusibacter TaxID=2624464 RepID=UPI001012BA02|nr:MULTISPECIES: rod-binding protein [unclassified Fusibacter]MCK8059852.1 rod-binding protein [Fusibacter sp. A2]NPE21654.1 flagellar biosynthesis protein FlgJ [Fusibacter sp. A1]RXV62058.1 flagellar biosynthesis protein FlgJ [Fusibacter sp. A1]